VKEESSHTYLIVGCSLGREEEEKKSFLRGVLVDRSSDRNSKFEGDKRAGLNNNCPLH
jgi:hypothetical protein